MPSPPVSFFKEVAGAAWTHDIPGAVCSLGSYSDVPSSVAVEGSLVSSSRQHDGASSCDLGICEMHSLVASGGEMVIQGSTPGSSSPSPVHRFFTDWLWGAYPRSNGGRGLISGGEELHINIVGELLILVSDNTAVFAYLTK